MLTVRIYACQTVKMRLDSEKRWWCSTHLRDGGWLRRGPLGACSDFKTEVDVDFTRLAALRIAHAVNSESRACTPWRWSRTPDVNIRLRGLATADVASLGDDWWRRRDVDAHVLFVLGVREYVFVNTTIAAVLVVFFRKSPIRGRQQHAG